MRRWTTHHEEWKDEVGSVAVESDDGLLFFDPLDPPAELGEPAHTFVTVFFHARDASGRVWAPATLVRRLKNRGVEVTDPFEPGDELPGGVQAFASVRDGEVVYWVPGERALVVALTGLALTACGSGGRQAAAPTTTRCPAATRALARIAADTAALQAAKPGHATDVATDRFLLHVDTAPISNLQRNRLIDHAAAAVATKCPQCFQALESARPIPAIRAGESRCPSR